MVDEPTDIVPAADAALSTQQAYNPLAGYTTEPEFDQGDAYVPKLRLAQGLTTEVQDGTARPGDWLLIGHVPVSEMVVVPLAFARKREMRDDVSRDVLCFSTDSVTGQGDPGGACAECPLGQWRPNPAYNEQDPNSRQNLPPACDMYYSYIVYSATHDALAILELRKSATKAARVLNTMTKQAGLGNFAVQVGTRKNSGPKGTFATPEFKALSQEDVAQVLEMAKDAFTTI